MKTNDLDQKLQAYYSKKREKEALSIPSFEEVLYSEPNRQESTKVYRYWPVAAAFLMLSSLGLWLYLPAQDSPEMNYPSMLTESLKQESEFIWNWEPPTQSLLDRSLEMVNQSPK